jgi:uncharacterized protein YceK
MKKKHILAVIVSLVILSGVIILSACASVAAVGQTSSMEAQVNTAVAATLIQYMVETKVAAQSAALALPLAGQEQATQPPPPTPTPVPTEPAPPTAVPTVEAPQPTAAAPAAPTPAPSPTAPPPPPPTGPSITADQNTNCRVGPSTGYTVQTYFVQGSVSTVEGKDKYEDWWYIVSPDDASEFCWVWEGSTTVQGDTSMVPVVAAPTDVYPTAGSPYYAWNVYKPYYTNSCTNYSNYCCEKKTCCGTYVKCKPNQNYCNPYQWGTCYPYYNCTCKPVYQNPCRKGGCPPITEVNYKNYCKKYPQCCDDD